MHIFYAFLFAGTCRAGVGVTRLLPSCRCPRGANRRPRQLRARGRDLVVVRLRVLRRREVLGAYPRHGVQELMERSCAAPVLLAVKIPYFLSIRRKAVRQLRKLPISKLIFIFVSFKGAPQSFLNRFEYRQPTVFQYCRLLIDLCIIAKERHSVSLLCRMLSNLRDSRFFNLCTYRHVRLESQIDTTA